MSRRKRSHNRHSRQRAYERYEVELSPRELQQAVDDIQRGRAQFIEVDTNTRSKYIVEIRGRDLYVVYSRSKKAIVTVLPSEALLDDLRKRDIDEKSLPR